MRTLLLSALAALVLGIFGAAPASADSEAQRAYDACTKYHNGEYLSKKKYKAIVSGVSARKTKCFWVWSHKSVGDAIRAATANCEKEFDKCYLYASSSGWSDWVTRISNMGGNDGTRGGGGGGGGGDAAAMGALLNGLLNGVVNGMGGGGGGGGGGDDDYTGGGGSVCTPAQKARGWSEERCARN